MNMEMIKDDESMVRNIEFKKQGVSCRTISVAENGATHVYYTLQIGSILETYCTMVCRFYDLLSNCS